MSVLSSNEDIEELKDHIAELESKIILSGEIVKKLNQRVVKLEQIAKEKGLLDKTSDDDVCVIC
mgnify:CR=1 FL=1